MAAAHRTAPLLKPHDELRRERPAPAEEVAPRLVDDIQLLAGEGFHRRADAAGDVVVAQSDFGKIFQIQLAVKLSVNSANALGRHNKVQFRQPAADSALLSVQSRCNFSHAFPIPAKIGKLSVFFGAPFFVGARVVMPDFFHAVTFAFACHQPAFKRLGCGLEDVVVSPRQILNEHLLVSVTLGDGLQDGAGFFAKCHSVLQAGFKGRSITNSACMDTGCSE